LGLPSMGFGAPGNPAVVDQPWGHLKPDTGAVPPGRAADNPPVYGPAGTVHATLADFVTYATLHSRGDNGESGLLLAPDTFQDLHKDWFDQSYALGWRVLNRDWAAGKTLSHDGR